MCCTRCAALMTVQLNLAFHTHAHARKYIVGLKSTVWGDDTEQQTDKTKKIKKKKKVVVGAATL